MEREAFLERISTGLGRERPIAPPNQPVRGVPDFYRDAPYGSDAGEVDPVQRFQAELEALGGSVQIADSDMSLGQLLRKLIAQLAPRTTITWDRREFDGWNIDWLWDELGAITYVPNADSESDEMRAVGISADVGVTLADFAVANTGTLALVTTAARARSVSLLPTVHIVLIDADQIVDRIGVALSKFSEYAVAKMPSSIHFISGPSRSADIENDLSIGVHGPAALYVLIRNYKP